MADLYILAVDLPAHPKPSIEAYKYKAGDVIAVLDDDAGPGTGVEISNLYKVVRVPGPVSDWQYLLADRPYDEAKEMPRRIKTLDITEVYKEFGKSTTPSAKMGEVSLMDSAAIKAMEKNTEAKVP